MTAAHTTAARQHARRAGGFAALYVAAAYLAAIPYFVFFVDYPGATEPDDKVTLLVDHHTSLYVMHLVSFEFVALALIVVTLAIHQHLRDHAPATSQVAVVVGLVRAGLLLASVMVFNHVVDGGCRLTRTLSEKTDAGGGGARSSCSPPKVRSAV